MADIKVIDEVYASSIGVQGPVGPKGDPAFLQFKIDTNGNLILEQESSNYTFQIVDGELVVNF